MELDGNFKKILLGIGGFVLLLASLWLNPFSYNDGGSRTVVSQTGGTQFVQFAPGIFYAGFFAKEAEWPNQISVKYMEPTPNLDFVDNGIDIGQISVMFSDGMTADVKGVAQFILPSTEQTMIELHNIHRTPQSLVEKRLATFTKGALQSAAQLMSSDKHYGGGRTQMSQDYLDQMRNGIYISNVTERVEYDSVDMQKKKLYLAEIRKDKNGQPLRQSNPLSEFQITVADANAIDAKYDKKFYAKLDKIIDATTRNALSRQNLMTAQQEALTKKAEGEKELVEIEYATKKDQTKQVVEAQTRVEVSKQNKLQQQADYEAALIEAKRRSALADVTAYEKRTVIQADGALEQKLAAWKFSEEKKWEAFGKFQGSLVPQIQTGNSGGNGGANALNFMELMSAQAAKELALDLKVTNKGN